MKVSTPTTSERPASSRVANIPPGAALAAARFLLWARSNGFAVTKLTVEDVTVECADFRIADGDAKAEERKPPMTVHDALAEELGLPRPSDAEVGDDEGDEVSP